MRMTSVGVPMAYNGQIYDVWEFGYCIISVLKVNFVILSVIGRCNDDLNSV